MSQNAQCFFAIITAVTNIMLVIGIFAAFQQVRAAQQSLKAQVLIKLFDEWRNKDIYQAMSYINQLRTQWKKYPINQWDNLAKKWVEEHSGKNPNSRNRKERELADEWAMRRTASQFIAKMGALIESGYLLPDEFFKVVPEVGRQLAVLIPVEVAIRNHWSEKEIPHLANWDYPVPKWEFKNLWKNYIAWFEKNGSKYSLNTIDWENFPALKD